MNITAEPEEGSLIGQSSLMERIVNVSVHNEEELPCNFSR